MSWATSAYGATKAANPHALWVAVNTPTEFTRAHAYTHLFSGHEHYGRAAMEWDKGDPGLADLTYDGAKAYAGRVHVMTVMGEHDIDTEQEDKDNRLSSANHVRPTVGPESSSDEDGTPSPTGVDSFIRLDKEFCVDLARVRIVPRTGSLKR